ncbi:MAG: hypothetical protein FWC16_14975 [Defluviitaleaceae bacterium]|nr:hypothetical protein [Defluviitaleaceae bacterium]MCL2276219.1 hypothetical protein [Defluviitaleaceae bacterium]
MGVNYIAACLSDVQIQVCKQAGIPVMPKGAYAASLGEITQGCVTDYSVHCFNSDALLTLANLGVTRATLHPELNLAQIRDIKKPIETEIILYGKLPLMKLGVPLRNGALTDRKNTQFYMHGDTLYNTVPIFMADKMRDAEKAGITHGRLIFTDETEAQVREVLHAYKRYKALNIPFTRGKFYSRV